MPYFHGYVPTLHKLKLLPAFWTLFVLLVLGLIRYVILLRWSGSPLNFLLIFSFIMSCALKLVIVGFLNYTQLNFIRQRYQTFVFVLLKITLIVIVLQSITDFCLSNFLGFTIMFSVICYQLSELILNLFLGPKITPLFRTCQEHNTSEHLMVDKSVRKNQKQ